MIDWWDKESNHHQQFKQADEHDDHIIFFMLIHKLSIKSFTDKPYYCIPLLNVDTYNVHGSSSCASTVVFDKASRNLHCACILLSKS